MDRGVLANLALILAAVSTGIGAQSPVAQTERRIALVIGNATYEFGKLKNPVNDAIDVADTLKPLGFNVILRTDASQREMKRALRDFRRQLSKGGVALFYYAGHGLQSKGRNYLVP